MKVFGVPKTYGFHLAGHCNQDYNIWWDVRKHLFTCGFGNERVRAQELTALGLVVLDSSAVLKLRFS